jgi:hypothetical protein
MRSGLRIASVFGVTSEKIKMMNVMSVAEISSAYSCKTGYTKTYFIAICIVITVAKDEAKVLSALFPNKIKEIRLSL